MVATLSTLGQNNLLRSEFTSLQGQIQQLQTQVATAQKAQVYGDLGSQALLDINLRQQANVVNNLKNSVSQVQVRTSLVDTSLGIINSTVPFAPLWGSKGARFDTLKFNWLGTLDRAEGVCTLWHTSPVKTWSDMLLKELTVGSIGAGSEMELYPAMLNKLFATRIKVVAGYKAGSDIDLAIERGELDGRCGTHLTSFRALHPGWFAERKILVPVIIAERRRADLADTPAVMEFVRDETTRQQLELMMVAQNMDRPVLAPPGVPAERVKELRAAFDATMADHAFRADIEKRSLHIDPMRGTDMAAAYAKAFSFPPEIISAVRDVMGAK